MDPWNIRIREQVFRSLRPVLCVANFSHTSFYDASKGVLSVTRPIGLMDVPGLDRLAPICTATELKKVVSEEDAARVLSCSITWCSRHEFKKTYSSDDTVIVIPDLTRFLKEILSLESKNDSQKIISVLFSHSLVKAPTEALVMLQKLSLVLPLPSFDTTSTISYIVPATMTTQLSKLSQLLADARLTFGVPKYSLCRRITVTPRTVNTLAHDEYVSNVMRMAQNYWKVCLNKKVKAEFDDTDTVTLHTSSVIGWVDSCNVMWLVEFGQSISYAVWVFGENICDAQRILAELGISLSEGVGVEEYALNSALATESASLAELPSVSISKLKKLQSRNVQHYCFEEPRWMSLSLSTLLPTPHASVVVGTESSMTVKNEDNYLAQRKHQLSATDITLAWHPWFASEVIPGAQASRTNQQRLDTFEGFDPISPLERAKDRKLTVLFIVVMGGRYGTVETPPTTADQVLEPKSMFSELGLSVMASFETYMKDANDKSEAFVQHIRVIGDTISAPNLEQMLTEIQPHILQISGHGVPSGSLMMMGRGDILTPEAIIGVINQHCNNGKSVLEALVFNSWYSDIYPLGLKNLPSRLHCCMGMREVVPEQAAFKFSRHFYLSLAKGYRYLDAFRIGMLQMGIALVGAPVINLRKPFISSPILELPPPSDELAYTKWLKMPPLHRLNKGELYHVLFCVLVGGNESTKDNPASNLTVLEADSIERFGRQALFGSHVEFHIQLIRSPGDLLHWLSKRNPHMIFVSGHSLEGGRLHFSSEFVVEPDDFISLVSSSCLAPESRLESVVFNTCYSDVFPLKKAKWHDAIHCVVGIRGKVQDRDSVEFSTRFFQGLANLYSYADAFESTVSHFTTVGEPGREDPGETRELKSTVNSYPVIYLRYESELVSPEPSTMTLKTPTMITEMPEMEKPNTAISEVSNVYQSARTTVWIRLPESKWYDHQEKVWNDGISKCMEKGISFRVTPAARDPTEEEIAADIKKGHRVQIVTIQEARKWALLHWRIFSKVPISCGDELCHLNIEILDKIPSPLNLTNPTDRIKQMINRLNNFFFIADCIHGPPVQDGLTNLEMKLGGIKGDQTVTVFYGCQKTPYELSKKKLTVTVTNKGPGKVHWCCVLFAHNGEAQFFPQNANDQMTDEDIANSCLSNLSAGESCKVSVVPTLQPKGIFNTFCDENTKGKLYTCVLFALPGGDETICAARAGVKQLARLRTKPLSTEWSDCQIIEPEKVPGANLMIAKRHYLVIP